MARLRGEWIIAIASRDRLIIGRDAAGVRTAYWGSHNGRVMVAIEPKGVTTVGGFPRRIHPPSLAQFLAFSFVPGERTALADLSEVPAGHRLDVDLADRLDALGAMVPARGDRRAEDAPPERVDQRDTARRSIARCAERRRARWSRSTQRSSREGWTRRSSRPPRRRRRRETREPPPISLVVAFRHDDTRTSSSTRRPSPTHSAPITACSRRRGRSSPSDLRTTVWHLDEPIGDPVTAGNCVPRPSRGPGCSPRS